MARNSTDKWNDLNDIANINMMIAGASGQGGSPGQSYRRPLQNPDPGDAVFGVEKGGQTFFEFLKAMGIDPANNIRKTGGPLTNDDSYGENETPGRPGWQLQAHGGQHYDEYGRPIQDPAFGIDPGGNPIYLEHMEQSPEEHKRNKDLHIKKYGKQAQVDYGVPTERDKWLQLYQGPGGTLRHIDNDLRKLILQRGAMKADASNNIRKLAPWQTVLDDDRPGHLKLIRQWRPPKA